MPHNLRETLGAALIGSGFAATLTGVVTTQTVYYFQNFPDDKRFMKLLVLAVWFLDFLHTIMAFSSDWMWFIEHFSERGIDNWIPWPLGLTVVLTALVTVLVHSFFAFRIHRLSRGNWFVVGPILILAAARLALASVSCGEMIRYPSFTDFVEKAKWIFTMGLLTSTILDIVVTSCLLWYLDRARTGFAGMDQIVNTLSLYAIENGVLTSVGIVTSLGCWLGMQDNLVFLGIHFGLSKLYAISLLATLNRRKYIRERNRTTCLEVLIHREVQPGGTGSDLKDHLGTHGGEEKSSMGNDDERDIPLSPIRGTTGGRDSLETASTSKLGAIVDMR